MVILSVDHGNVRTGVAVSDRDEILSSPVTVITEPDDERLSEKICEIADEYRAELIVVGLPKNMDGTEGESAQHCREFARMIHEKSGIPVDLSDERLTTVSAHGYLNATNTRGKKRKQIVDAVSAVIILEDYIRKRENKV